MRMKFAFAALLFSWGSLLPLSAVVSMPVDASTSVGVAQQAEGPAKEALEAFKAGRHAKAIELAKPLADQGNGDALYLLGYSAETGQGSEASREKALEYYRKASAAGHKDSTYRLSFILLASEDEQERNQGREALEAAAKNDPAVAGRILGEAWLRGRLSKEGDFDKTVLWWNRAAEAGDIPSLLLLGRLYEGQFGFADKVDAKRALESYRKAAGMGNAGAMAALGSRLLNGPEAQRNEKEGRDWLKKAIDAKEYSAYVALGDYEENVKKDLKAALEAYQKGDEAGQVDSTLRAADFYMNGKGVAKDQERGIRLLEKAATAGSAAAHWKLAAVRLAGESPDLTKGYGHILSAANGGIAEAQNELALLYLSGKMGVADNIAAIAWLTRAAQSGFAPAQNNLALVYERGGGATSRNLTTAAQLYALAANQGHAPATLSLARLLALGGGKENLPKAWALATLAAERGQEDGTKLAAEIDAKLDASEKTEAKKALDDIKSGKKPESKAANGDKPATETKPTATKPKTK
jgi:TPR repeat protein